MTLMSGKVYSDAGTPSNAVGDQGDIFMQLDGLKTTYRKEGGAWTPIGNQLGTIPEFLKGIGVPSNAVGEDNQYYREVNTDAIYEKQSGVWTNIGSWTALETQQLLQSNGIGADLQTTNHVSNIDTFIEAGAEGYYNGTTTGTKPSTYGLVKAWRENPTEIYQKVETSDGKWATRKSSNGGATWPAWRIMANEDGDSTRKFKALTGVADDDVAVVGQLPTDGLIQVGGTIRSAYAEATGVYLSSTPADIVTATISCSAGVATKFRVTAKIPFDCYDGGGNPTANFKLVNVTDGSDIDTIHLVSPLIFNTPFADVAVLQREITITPPSTTAQFKVQGTATFNGKAGPTWNSVASYCTLLIEVIRT